MFVIEASKWTMEKNMNLIECIAKQYIEADIIRFVTTPSELIDPNNNDIRYVGQTINIKQRYNRHISDAFRKNTHIYCWIKSLIKDNKKDMSPEAFLAIHLNSETNILATGDINVNLELINTSHIDFKDILLNKIKVKKLFIGADFKFGKKNLGDIKYLNEYIECKEINFKR